MTSLVFPDINVWLAMAFAAHAHHTSAKKWFDALSEQEELIFCRFTQLGLLRLLTLPAVMGNRVKTQPQAWQIYDTFVMDGNARLMQEPRLLDRSFRRFASLDSASPQSWADGYLAAFAEEAGAILVTFDKTLAGRVDGSILLGV
jgi:toxin-antitoxin system PIN domain toxin